MRALSKPASIFSRFRLALRGGEQEFTKDRINRAILLLSIPVIMEMATEALFVIVDVFYVGLLHNTDALAIVVLTESMLTLVYSVATGLGIGATAMVARRIGEKDKTAAADVGVQTIYLGLGVSLLVGVIGLFGDEHLLQLMGTDQHIIDNYLGYSQWMLTANITIVMLVIINGVFRSRLRRIGSDAGPAHRQWPEHGVRSTVHLQPWAGARAACGRRGHRRQHRPRSSQRDLPDLLPAQRQEHHRDQRAQFPANLHLMLQLFKLAPGASAHFFLSARPAGAS